MKSATWRIEAWLGVTRSFRLARAVVIDDVEPVLLKIARDTADTARLRDEQALMLAMAVPGVAPPGPLLEGPGGLAVVLGPAGLVPLVRQLAPKPWDWRVATRLVLTLLPTLSALHARGLVHRDLRPGNLLFDERAQALRVADFSAAAPPAQAPSPEGADDGMRADQDHPGDPWAYLSPEQTGRTGRPVDACSDLYAVGVLMYRLLAGRLPFDAADPLEWAHCHLARVPPTLVEAVRGLPPVIAGIVAKLLAKAPEERYQSAAGLQVDLDRCLRDASELGDIRSFPLGAHDLAGRLELPQTLVGRDAEEAALASALDAVAASRRSRLVLLAGEAGIGKTALALRLRERTLAAGGRYAAGKHDLEQRDVPYSALARALDGLVRPLLAASEAELASWRARFDATLGINTGLAARLVPALGPLLGATVPPAELDAAAAQRRLHRVLRQILVVLAGTTAPLVLFLDDLHAADPGTLSLLAELLADPQSTPMLAVGTSRTADGSLPQPVAALVDRLRQDQVPLLRIDLAPWGRAEVTAVLAAMLGRQAAGEVESLAALVHEKTAGNPFFVVEFLRELHAESLLRFDPGRGGWSWELDAIGAKGYSDNVVELMLRRLQRLAPDTRLLLRQAACLGSVATTDLLAALSGQTPDRLATVLADAVQASLVLPLAGSLNFAHDRVREAAYELIPLDERAAMHLQAGRLLLARLAPAELEHRLFDVVHQFNRGAALLQGDEAAQVWALNIRAGRQARSASAYASARSYFLQALQRQPARAWQTAHDQAFELTLELAESESVAGDPDAGERALDTGLLHARNDLERVRVHSTRSRLRLFWSRYRPSLDAALAALRLLELEFPDDDAGLQAMLEADCAALDLTLAGRRPADLLQLPTATEPSPLSAIALLVDAFFPARNSRPALFLVLVVKAVMLSLQHGNTVQSCQAYAQYPRLLRRHGRLDEAYEYSLLSLQLAERLGATALKGSLLFSHMASSYFLRRPYASGLPLLDEGFSASLQSGSLYDATGCALVALEYLLECGATLEQIVKGADAYAPSLGRAQAGLWPPMLRSFAQFARALQGLTRAPDSLDGDDFSEAAYEAALKAADARPLQAVFLVLKQVAACIAGHHAQALDLAQRAAELLRSSAGMAIEITHRSYRALSAAALCPRDAPPEPLVALLRSEHEAMRSLADVCPHNFRHRWLLIGAELARVQGRDAEAEGLFGQSIDTAQRHGFIAHEAQALERAAAFHAERGQAGFARACLQQARQLYQRWGAHAKVRALDADDPPAVPPARSGATDLDALAVAKASQALSGLIDVEQLIDALMRIALDHAGAQTAHLYLMEGETLHLAAAAAVEGAQVRVHLQRAAAAADGPTPSVVNYVRRTREQVLLGDAAKPHPFSADPYMMREQPRSLMCLPLLRRTDLVGVLYLEHRLSVHAFTEGRVALLEMLAAQAAISLETARLYAALKDENAERRRAEQAAVERQSRLQRLVESNLVGVRFADLEGRIFEANDAFLQIVGYTRDDLAAGRLHRHEMTPPEYWEADAHALEQLLRHGRYAPYEKEYVRKDGSLVPVLVGGILFEGPPRESVAFVLDLTERRRAEAEREARVAAEAANRAKSSFLASMSHELRTPLNGILGYAQLLQLDADLPDNKRRGLATIEASGRHLLALINDILDLARIEAGRLDLAADSVDLRRMLELVADTVRPMAQRKALRFEVEVDPGLPQAVQADERRLSQVLINVLGNAVKFTDRGAVTLRASHRAEDGGCARLTFEVKDTGVGMSSEELQRIFRAFEQGGAAPRRADGSGLGLAITDALLRQMGGRIDVRSEPGRGSVFSVELTLPVLEDAAAATPEGTVTGYEGRRRTVLIADDVPENRAFLVDLLGSLGFRTLEAADGLQALASVRAIRPDLILMDNGMPALSGLEATKRLRADPGLAAVPIIAISAGASGAERRRCLDAGANAFVPKPVDVPELLQAIGLELGLQWTR